MIASEGVTPGAVLAWADSWRTTNVYVVVTASVWVSHADCVASQAFAAMKTNFEVHEPSEPFTLMT